MARLGHARRAPAAGPLVAGIELAAGAVRVVIGHRDGGRLRVTSVGSRSLPVGAIVAGLVVDRSAVEGALAGLLAHAEAGGRATRVVVALDGDDVRTFHLTTRVERPTANAPVTAAELARADHRAAADLAEQARAATSADLALRGIATVQAREDRSGYLLDGRSLASLVGFQGRLMDVRSDLTILPLVMSGAGLAVMGGRRASIACGTHALARSLVGSVTDDTAVVRVGADLTSVAVLRSGDVRATCSFSLGRSELEARLVEEDASVWASAVVEALGDGETPARWILGGVADPRLERALVAAAAERHGPAVEVLPLRLEMLTRVIAEPTLEVTDLVAVAAAALAAEISP